MRTIVCMGMLVICAQISVLADPNPPISAFADPNPPISVLADQPSGFVLSGQGQKEPVVAPTPPPSGGASTFTDAVTGARNPHEAEKLN